MDRSLPQQQVDTENTHFSNSLILEANHQNDLIPINGEIKETHFQENEKTSKDDVIIEVTSVQLIDNSQPLVLQKKIKENEQTSNGLDQSLFLKKIRENELETKDDDSKGKDLVNHPSLLQGFIENGLEIKDDENKDDENKVKELVDPLLLENRHYGKIESSKEPFDFHSQLEPADFTGINITDDAATQNINSGTSNGRDFNYYLPLYKAALKGDWGNADTFFRSDPNALNAVITSYQRTALHVAASSAHSQFVLNLVQRMDVNALALQDAYSGDTALHFAAVAGITEAAKAMVTKNKGLTQIQNKKGWTALLLCAAFVAKEQKDMIQYLCIATRNEEPSMPFSGHLGAQLICNIIAADLYDVALYLVQKYPNLATARDLTGCTALDFLAQKASAFPSGSRLGLFERPVYSLIPLQVDKDRVNCTNIINIYENHQLGYGDISNRGAFIQFLSWTNLIKVPGIKQVYLKKLAHIQALELLKCICATISLMSNNDILQFFLCSTILSTGTKFGIVELVMECIKTFPDQIWFLCMGRSIFHIAVEHRKEKIFNLMFGMRAQSRILSSWRVESNNNILHLAAKLPPPPQLNTVSGAALQMQRELLWFKEVEKIVQPTYRDLENQQTHKPKDIFISEHKELMEKGEKWMKDTAQSCMVVATLIATVVFAAAFTVPGGNISDTNSDKNGSPIYLRSNSFLWFIISDALGLFSSTTSVLMFLSILTSRYAEEDFLKSLPKRLILGLGTLFISIAAMMVAFAAALSIVLEQRLRWASIPISVLACLPVTLFALLQFPLLVEIYPSTYGAGIFRAEGNYKFD